MHPRHKLMNVGAAAALALSAAGCRSSQTASSNPTECAPAESAPAESALESPNILVLIADDWAWPDASCLGTPEARTPTFDRVAREGVFFTNAHCAAPSCSPSRAAILTGRMPWQLEQAANLETHLPKKFETYSETLAKAGYHVGLGGKGYGPGRDGGRGQNPAGPEFKPAEEGKDGFDAFLAARKPGQPFCYWFGSLNPHRPYAWRSGRSKGIDPDKVKVPPYLPDNETTREDFADYLGEVSDFDAECARHIESLRKTGEMDNTIIVITGDNGMPFPRSKCTLYMSGTHVPLAIRWPKGFPGGRKIEELVSLADLAPTFLEAAGLPANPDMSARSLMPLLKGDKAAAASWPAHVLTALETHVATARDIGGGAPGGYPARSVITKDFQLIRNFRPERWPAGDPRGMDASEPPWPFSYEQLAATTKLAFADCDASPTKAWMLLNRPAAEAAWSRAFAKRPEFELYDLRSDPHELMDLAGDPAHAATLRGLAALLDKELRAAGDPRATGGGDEFDRYNLEAINRGGARAAH